MRICPDEVVIADMVNLNDTPERRLSALGALLGRTTEMILPGSPLFSWCDGSALEETWTNNVPVLPGSLYETLEHLRELTPNLDLAYPVTPSDLHELRLRRRVLDEMMLT